MPSSVVDEAASATSASSSSQPIPISITICGDGGCGKSSITLRVVRSQWTNEYDPTIQDDYSITRRIDGTTYLLSLTDTAGQEEYRGLWAQSNLGADAFLLVYDITSLHSLDALSYFNELIDMEADTRSDNLVRAQKAGIPSSAYAHAAGSAKTIPPVKIVAGNKCDLQHSRQVPAAVGLEWARRHGCGFMETSALSEVNIEETFALIVKRVVDSRRLAELGQLAPQPKSAGGRNGRRKSGSQTAREPGSVVSPVATATAAVASPRARAVAQTLARLSDGSAGQGGTGPWSKQSAAEASTARSYPNHYTSNSSPSRQAVADGATTANHRSGHGPPGLDRFGMTKPLSPLRSPSEKGRSRFDARRWLQRVGHSWHRAMVRIGCLR